ncbi:MAG: hypothetical protein AAF664_12900, partial [Planctomycetota bacterium]
MSQTKKDDFSVVKEILLLISKHQTSASPKLYSVWYEYVCGKNDGLKAAIEKATAGGRKVSSSQLLELWNYHCVEDDESFNRISESFSTEVDHISSVVDEQKSAGVAFAGSLSTASATLSQSKTEDALVAGCVSKLEAAARSMQSKLDSTTRKLNEAQSQIMTLQSDLAESRKGMLTDPLTGIGNRRMFDSLVK